MVPAMSMRVFLGAVVALACACGDDSSTGTTDAATGSAGTDGSGESTAAPSGSSGEATTTASTGADTGSEPTTSADETAGEGSTSGGVDEDLDMSPEDFVCLLDWDPVRRFRITNLLGHLDETLEVANSPTGGVYPVGTVIQLIPNEAMVKRGNGWSPETNDWEFFSLQTSAAGTEILDRGATKVVNQFGGNCFTCHADAEPQWDFVCEQDHGCVPLPLSAEAIAALQDNDPRCD